MGSNMDALTKLASELTDRVEELEKQNEQLCAENKTLKEAQVKQAAAAVVSEEVAAKTCELLVKAGSIQPDQVEATKQAFLHDPEAAHRTIEGFVDALAQAKTAAGSTEQEVDDVSGGRLATPLSGQNKTAEENCLDRMAQILNMGHNNSW